MYEEFYNLKEKPFDLNPSPRFLYLSDTHKEALALLTYAVMERKGFILLTGEVGTGKTTIVQALLATLDKNIQYIYISNPLMSTHEFFDYIAFNIFKKKIHFKSKADFLIEFEEYLKRCHQHQKTFILIIDESQTLSYELLEEIRLLSNLESSDEKLINIFLIGQPELNDKLSEPRYRPILQRINNRYHLKPLDLSGTRSYISTRLKVAGINKYEDIFSAKTVKALYEYSEGYPRMINVLADNALLLGYSKEKKKITPDMIKECYEDVNIKPSRSEIPAAKPEIIIGQRREKAAWGGYRRSILLVLFFALVIFVGLSLVQNKLNYQGEMEIPGEINPFPSTIFDPKEPDEPEQNDVITMNDASLDPDQQKIPLSQELKPESTNVEEPIKEDNEEHRIDESSSPAEMEEKPSTLVRVKEGDTLTKLSIEIYGRNDSTILDMISRHNPDLKDINRISVGQEILFPSLPGKNEEARYTVQIGSFEDFKSAQDQFQKLIRGGNETYILPIIGKDQGFRVTLGSFQNRSEAEQFALNLIKKQISGSVEVIKINLN